MSDLFEGPDYEQQYIEQPRKRKSAYAAMPGTGPEDKTCKDCEHKYRQQGGNRHYNKCDLVEATHGAGTDIKVSSKACRLFEPRES